MEIGPHGIPGPNVLWHTVEAYVRSLARAPIHQRPMVGNHAPNNTWKSRNAVKIFCVQVNNEVMTVAGGVNGNKQICRWNLTSWIQAVLYTVCNGFFIQFSSGNSKIFVFAFVLLAKYWCRTRTMSVLLYRESCILISAFSFWNKHLMCICLVLYARLGIPLTVYRMRRPELLCLKTDRLWISCVSKR